MSCKTCRGRRTALGFFVALRRRGSDCRCTQRGIAALEFALVMPSIILLFLGIGTFSSALYAKQGLYDMAGEAARTCVLKKFTSYDAVTNCVTGVGSFLNNNVQKNVCLGSPVMFNAQVGRDGSVVTQIPSVRPQEIDVLQVTASCSWSFNWGLGGFGVSGPSNLSATASMPLLFDNNGA